MTTGKFKKNQEKSRRKMLIEEYREEHPYIPTDEEILENNSYWDIDYLEEANKKTNEGIRYWEERYNNASGNMGKWYCQIRLNRLYKKLHKYVDKK
jgi:hypothetical protein